MCLKCWAYVHWGDSLLINTLGTFKFPFLFSIIFPQKQSYDPKDTEAGSLWKENFSYLEDKTYLEDEKPSTSALVIVSELEPFLCCLTVAEHLRPRHSSLLCFFQACVLSRVRCAPGCCSRGGFLRHFYSWHICSKRGGVDSCGGAALVLNIL